MDAYEAEFHLTSEGWVPGSYYFFGGRLGVARPRPIGTVETWIRHVNDRSPESEECLFWSRSWKDEYCSDEELRALRQAIGLPLYNAHFMNCDLHSYSQLLEASEFACVE